jgi:hypothetical protein
MGNFMITKESQFQQKFGQWVEKNGRTCAYELKISHGNTVTWSKFQDAQLPSLWKVYTGTKNFKLSDASFGTKPFDGFCLKNEAAYVGIMFNIPANQKEFYLIHIKDIMKIRDSGAKSIKKKDCEKVGMKFSF